MACPTQFNECIYGRVQANESDQIIHFPLSDIWSSDFGQYRSSTEYHIGSSLIVTINKILVEPEYDYIWYSDMAVSPNKKKE